MATLLIIREEFEKGQTLSGSSFLDVRISFLLSVVISDSK